jgi:hypothetical protein
MKRIKRNMDFDTVKFRTAAEEALPLSSEYIRGAITGSVDLSKYLIKGDKTAVTIVDGESQRLARPILISAFPDYAINQEEVGGAEGVKGARIAIYHDPLDGTGTFLIGAPNPTVILGAYDRLTKQVLATATMEPISGRFWFSARGEGTKYKVFDYDSLGWSPEETRHVNNQGIRGSLVTVDVSHPFTRTVRGTGESRLCLQQGERRKLTTRLENAGAKESCMNSNGASYAFLSLGRPMFAGHITTAIGGPFDVIGLLHVLESGGAAQCYLVSQETSGRKLERLAPEDIEAADMVIAANNPDNLMTLEQILRGSLS